MIRVWWLALLLGLLLGSGPVDSSPRKHEWHQVKGTVGGSISLALNLTPGEMEDKSHLDFQPQHGAGLELAIFMGGHWKRSESSDRFGQRLELASETVVRITGLEMEDSGLFKVSVRLPLAKIWYHTFNLTVYDTGRKQRRQHTLWSWHPKPDSNIVCLVGNPVDQKKASHDLLRVCPNEGSSFHWMRYISMAVWEPGLGLSRFVVVGYVDGQLITHSNSATKRMEPRVPWMEKVTEEDPHYWDGETNILRHNEAVSRRHMATLRDLYNQSGGLHTWQTMYGCDLSGDVPRGGYWQYGYEGKDFIAFDKETLTWTAADSEALIIKRKWDADIEGSVYRKASVEKSCIDWLRKFLRYGKQALLRKDPPVMKVTHKDSQDGLETLLCQAHGFYPKEIEITWRKDGEVRHENTFSGVVSPNADGTYYTWLSIEIDPKERSRYQCHVEHDGLQDPLDLNVEESGSAWLIGVGVATVVSLGLAGAGIFICVKKGKTNNNNKEA